MPGKAKSIINCSSMMPLLAKDKVLSGGARAVPK